MFNALKVTVYSIPKTLNLKLNIQGLCFPKERPFHLNISLKESPKSNVAHLLVLGSSVILTQAAQSFKIPPNFVMCNQISLKLCKINTFGRSCATRVVAMSSSTWESYGHVPSIPVKNIETQNFKGSENHTWIGPPHELSNLRLKVFPQTQNLTHEEKHFYHRSQEIQDWNQTYWENHNKDFIESRKKFLEKIVKEKNLPKKEALTSQEMSEFYKHFLDTNHKKHMQYNWNWYKKNVTLIFLAAKAKYSKLRKIFKS